MNKHIEYLKLVEANCLRCHSCRCFHSTSKIGTVCYGELATLLLNGEGEEFISSIFGCHQCGLCLKKCPRKFNAKEFMFHARAYLEEENHEHCKYYDSVRVDQAKNVFTSLRKENPYTLEDVLKGESQCERLFVPGCHMSASFPKLTEKVMAFLKEKGIADGMTTICCGNPLYASGLYKEFESYVEKMDTLYKKHGVKVITTPCPSCYDFNLRIQEMGYLKGIEIHCLSKDLVDHGVKINRDKFEKDYSISIHDSCPDRLRGIFADSIRELYRDFEIKELKHIKENTLCCGCGGLVPPYSQEISAKGKKFKKSDFEMAGSDYLITSCFNCYKGLKEVIPTQQYLADLVEERI